MTIINMSDGRNFTDYRNSKVQMSEYRNVHNVGDSQSLRHSLIQNAEKIMNDKPPCTPEQAQGMAVQCGGPIAQYVSTPSQRD